jgi:hypothetical protein
MPRPSRQPCAFHWTTDERGAAGLLVMIVVLAVAVLIVSSTALHGLDDLEIGYEQQVGSDILLSAESCAEEALLRLSRNNTYNGGTLNVGAVACTITVTGTPCGACTIGVDATDQNFTRHLEVDVTVSGSDVDLIRWEEI